jgi:SAM-dependent methyltransferase
MTDSIAYELGCRMPLADWVSLNRTDAFRDSGLKKYVSPLPPRDLMQNVSGLVNEQDFASHGADFYIALSEAAPKPLSEFRSILDFGCGCGRLARMFKGHPHRIEGCDIDRRHVEWINGSLDFMRAKVSSVKPPIPYADNEFEAVISISIFTHLNEQSQDQFLRELCRVTAPRGRLFLTVHGERALARAVDEPAIRAMLDVPDDRFAAARAAFAAGEHAFILQFGHLTTMHREGQSLLQKLRRKVIEEPFEYGITFIPEAYIRKHWRQWFEVLDYRVGALHDFQDIVVLEPRK